MASNQRNTETKREEPVQIETNGKKIYVVSDLHMAAGLKANGNYDGTENFYADQSFVRFLDHLQEHLQARKAMLIINGDFIDFLRICSYPETPDDFRCWQEILTQAGITKTIEELTNPETIDDKEKRYGLKTHDYKSVWKLYICIRGHKPFFKRLAQWVYEGNELLVVKGNHDVEWYWPAVQQYLQVALESLVADNEHYEALRKAMKSRIRFYQDSLIMDEKLYIEHGHLYEEETKVEGSPTLDGGQELRIPFGSFFNRYLINRLELSYPFLDNVRPTQNILMVLMKENFFKAMEVLFKYIPFTVKMIPKAQFYHTRKYLFNFFFIIVVPVLIFLYLIYQTWINKGFSIEYTKPLAIVMNGLKCGAVLLLSYVIGQVLSHLRFKKSMPFSKRAEEIFDRYPNVEAVLFGHTHDPEQNNLATADDTIAGRKHKWYFNTGTWIPVFETDSANVRFDKTYTFIAIDCGESPLCRERLQRWNDDAGRTDTMILNDKM